jgi:hypothetical protein
MSKGMINPKNDEKTPLNVTKMHASHSGKKNPAPMPAAIAISILTSNGISLNLSLAQK